MFEFITILLGLAITVAIIMVARFAFRWALAQSKVMRMMKKSTRWYHRYQHAKCFLVYVDQDGIDFTVTECEAIHTRVQKEFWLAVAERENVRFW